MSEPEMGIDGLEPDEFEQRLTQALRRVDAPEGFAARVMEDAAHAMRLTMRPHFARPRVRAWGGGAIAAMLALGLFVGGRMHVRHEREQAALANQQFETAVRVTDHALDQARAQLERAGLKLGN